MDKSVIWDTICINRWNKTVSHSRLPEGFMAIKAELIGVIDAGKLRNYFLGRFKRVFSLSIS